MCMHAHTCVYQILSFSCYHHGSSCFLLVASSQCTLYSPKHFSVSRYSFWGCDSFYKYIIAGASWYHRVSQSEVDHSIKPAPVSSTVFQLPLEDIPLRSGHWGCNQWILLPSLCVFTSTLLPSWKRSVLSKATNSY